MKQLFTFKSVLTLLMIVLIFSACKKEGVYSPSKKLKRIYTTYSSTGIKSLKQEWTWNKNLLSKVQYYNNNMLDYYEQFIYNGKRLINVEGSDGSSTKIIYDGSKYDKWQYYDWKGRLEIELEFEHDKNKISEIKMTGYKYPDNSKSASKNSNKFINRLIPAKMMEDICMLQTQNTSNSGNNMKAASIYTRTITISYDGNNVSEWKYFTISDNGDYYQSSFAITEYDKKSNPLYHDNYGTSDVSYGNVMYDYFSFSKNNPLKETYSVTEKYNYETKLNFYITEYSYQYDGKFPTKVIEKTQSSKSSATTFREIYYDYE